MAFSDWENPAIREVILNALVDKLAAEHEEQQRRWLDVNTFERARPIRLPLLFDRDWPEIIYEDVLDADSLFLPGLNSARSYTSE